MKRGIGIKIGFTGTKEGMSKEQFIAVSEILKDNFPFEVHHGACIGADKHFHDIATSLMINVILHPGVNRQGKCFTRADCQGYNDIKPERYFLDRDKDIVNACDVLIATPRGFKEVLRSGTWATVRYARKKSKEIWIIYPDGSYSTD